MKKHINLLVQKKDYKKREFFFKLLRRLSLILGMIAILFLITAFYLQQDITKQYQSLLSQKEILLKQIILRNNVEKQISYFNEKSKLFNKIKNEDINLQPYYRILRSYLPVSTQSAGISSIKYNNKKEIEFDLIFSSYEDLYDSLSNLEDESFLNIFQNLTLNSINLSEFKIKNYKLSFKGELKAIPNEKQN